MVHHHLLSQLLMTLPQPPQPPLEEEPLLEDLLLSLLLSLSLFLLGLGEEVKGPGAGAGVPLAGLAELGAADDGAAVEAGARALPVMYWTLWELQSTSFQPTAITP
jgi:hypothetical protein